MTPNPGRHRAAFLVKGLSYLDSQSLQTVFALGEDLSRRGCAVSVCFHGFEKQEAEAVCSRFSFQTRSNVRKALRDQYGLAPSPGVRVLAAPHNKRKHVPDFDFLISTTLDSAAWADAFPVDKGLKIFLGGLEPESIYHDERARASLRVPAVKVALTRAAGDRFKSMGELAYSLAGPGSGLDVAAAGARLADMFHNLQGPETRQYLFRRRTGPDIAPVPPAPGSGINVLLITGEPNACAQIRLFSPNNLLNRQGINARYCFVDRGVMVSEQSLAWADILVFQRIRDRRYRKVLQRAKSRGKKIFFEIDDNLFAIPPEHMFHKSAYKNDRMKEFIKESHAVIVTNENLKSYLETENLSRRVFVFANYIDTEIFIPGAAPRRDPDCVTIGYSGTVTHNYEFAMATPAIIRIMQEYGKRVKLKFIGYIPDELKGLDGVEAIRETDSYHMYAALFAGAGIDIALAPLKDNLFNACKSNIKYLEYSALGIPGVYSALAPYTSCIQDGRTGLLVHSEDSEAWYDAIKKLIDDKALRADMGARAQQDVLAHHALDGNVHKLLSIYREILA